MAAILHELFDPPWSPLKYHQPISLTIPKNNLILF